MDKSHYVVVGGSSGIGYDIISRLVEKGVGVIVISRSADNISGMHGVTHMALDITRQDIDAAQLPASIQGLAYCPGSIRLRQIRELSRLSPNSETLPDCVAVRGDVCAGRREERLCPDRLRIWKQALPLPASR